MSGTSTELANQPVVTAVQLVATNPDGSAAVKVPALNGSGDAAVIVPGPVLIEAAASAAAALTGIKSMSVSLAGNLIVTLVNGTVIDAGNINPPYVAALAFSDARNSGYAALI